MKEMATAAMSVPAAVIVHFDTIPLPFKVPTSIMKSGCALSSVVAIELADSIGII